jgi:hypothetical protein
MLRWQQLALSLVVSSGRLVVAARAARSVARESIEIRCTKLAVAFCGRTF